ncbi:bifunctional phosphopantothenoylcysteine decarboxylase/phosphopantothenate--cysteine ligase CoaBC [Desulfofundulus sp. TPOSR]|uniref:bifunctional phosphopantothenoylcysteine decarboxylase/phosphopantothenate--cysteine ligase CoaBC n=1 Tax=Desulfofundulus sp. TPOSR TaxID=2714340 RepID=UPI001407C8D5|nr:bifunctional phosphopantothenoylcysteine decarboxylase/phosphopantothenate--cysteine ligase CoaBC [Desulfofundulus sp. TPOSR]NHM25642.1 bifunctional phosphopantothenoylcysteine decarboxylase/phosphopantothenate--cysteine ligase CoaBC [Desulfofundulus sp. TPOSR]
MLADRSVILGVTGGIAAYKAAELASALVKAGALVDVVMTQAAQEFVRPLTFAALTGRPVHTDLFNPPAGGAIPHIELATRADLVVIAPATANILAKLAHGLADDLLSSLVLAVTCPVLLCPAMNACMYAHPAVQANLKRLVEMGYHILEPEAGRLACGVEGRGRLPAPEVILEHIKGLISSPGDFGGIKVLVTAGGTREPLDPVRYISNRSSGKMGYALAAAAIQRGAAVTLVSAPTSLDPPAGAELVSVETARQMYQAVMERFSTQDVVIKAAAVADYRPKIVADQKIKKSEGTLILELEKNPDILYELGQRKEPHQTLVGFAAETEDLEANAQQKLRKKNLDLLVANDVTQPGAGFGADTNIVKLFYRDGRTQSLPVMDKKTLAHRILDAVIELRYPGNS